MKLESGRKVELKKLTMAQRTECEEIPQLVYSNDESYMRGTTQARNQWCLYALGLTDIEDLVGYAPSELNEIAAIASGEASKAKDPTAGG